MYQSALSALLFAGTGMVLLASQFPLIRKVTEYSVHIMLGMLFLSMLFLILDKTKVMFAGLACTAALCIFLKNASLNTLKLPESNTETKLKIAHINLANISFDFAPIEALLEKEDVDIISFQEFTPDFKFLEAELKSKYPFVFMEMRIDPFGLAVFSRYPFISQDTFLSNDIPNLNVVVSKEERAFQVISSYLTPALDNKSLHIASRQLDDIASKVNISNIPLVALGEYNMVYWTNEIRRFRAKTKLQNSRRDLVDGNLRVPYDHIFFSEELECTQFKELKLNAQYYLGIMGTYQIKNNDRPYHTLNSQLSLVQ